MTRPETEIAAHVVEFLREEGWDVYQEVAYEGRRVDTVAARPKDLWIVEVKTSRSAAVIDQAVRGKGHANCVFVAVPKTNRDPMPWWDECCRREGLGEFTVDNEGVIEIRRSPVRQRMTDLGIRAVLREQHKDFAPAGNATGSRWSPFAQTARDLKAAVAERPGVSLLEFTGDRFKAEMLRRWIKRGSIKGLVVRSGKAWPEGFDRHRFKQEEA